MRAALVRNLDRLESRYFVNFEGMQKRFDLKLMKK